MIVALLLIEFVVVALVTFWLCELARTPPPEPLPPPPHEHAFVLHPVTHDKLSCMFCPLDVDLPRAAPRSLTERIPWARAHGMLHGQSGVSVAYLEALERAS